MGFKEYVALTKEVFSEISKLSQQEVDNYFKESETIKALEGFFADCART